MSKNYDASKIIARYQESPVSIGQVAAEFELCSVTVSRILKGANIHGGRLHLYNAFEQIFYNSAQI